MAVEEFRRTIHTEVPFQQVFSKSCIIHAADIGAKTFAIAITSRALNIRQSSIDLEQSRIKTVIAGAALVAIVPELFAVHEQGAYIMIVVEFMVVVQPGIQQCFISRKSLVAYTGIGA